MTPLVITCSHCASAVLRWNLTCNFTVSRSVTILLCSFLTVLYNFSPLTSWKWRYQVWRKLRWSQSILRKARSQRAVPSALLRSLHERSIPSNCQRHRPPVSETESTFLSFRNLKVQPLSSKLLWKEEQPRKLDIFHFCRRVTSCWTHLRTDYLTSRPGTCSMTGKSIVTHPLNLTFWWKKYLSDLKSRFQSMFQQERDEIKVLREWNLSSLSKSLPSWYSSSLQTIYSLTTRTFSLSEAQYNELLQGPVLSQLLVSSR